MIRYLFLVLALVFPMGCSSAGAGGSPSIDGGAGAMGAGGSLGGGGSGAGAEGGAGGAPANTDPIPVPTATCLDAQAKFSACGGDIKGTWSSSEICDLRTGQKVSASFEGCPGIVVEFAHKETNEGTFDGTMMNQQAGELISTVKFSAAPSCNPTGDGTCAALVKGGAFGLEQALWVCEAAGAVCNCTGTEKKPNPAVIAPYVITGTTLMLGDGTGPYCVQGDTFAWSTKFGPTGLPEVLYLIYRKK